MSPVGFEPTIAAGEWLQNPLEGLIKVIRASGRRLSVKQEKKHPVHTNVQGVILVRFEKYILKSKSPLKFQREVVMARK